MEETMQHLFFTSYAARIVWSYFLPSAGIRIEELTFHQAIIKCWNADVIPRIQPIIQEMPPIIVWELRKRRNNYKYEDGVTVSRVIYQVSNTLQSLVKFRKPSLLHVPHKWPDLVTMMEQYLPKLKITKVLWEFPTAGWIKLNTDGVSRGNPGRSVIGFVLRNTEGDMMYVCGKEIPEGTNTEAEAKAMVQALRFCIEHDISLLICTRIL
ncbi:uncharacterized protein LOC142166532 [Nicotiana tabacum]|uniref:Uncharacterized protein LOC142166532 n=1 Tax=Nicotiana tabacum TaxID=4097 RepID=A0AC58SAM4_TOBAC